LLNGFLMSDWLHAIGQGKHGLPLAVSLFFPGMISADRADRAGRKQVRSTGWASFTH
jgi:hypothetical protein